jgi:hypothetical protein
LSRSLEQVKHRIARSKIVDRVDAAVSEQESDPVAFGLRTRFAKPLARAPLRDQ